MAASQCGTASPLILAITRLLPLPLPRWTVECPHWPNLATPCLLPPALCLLPPALCLLPCASCLLPPALCLLPSASCLVPPALCLLHAQADAGAQVVQIFDSWASELQPQDFDVFSGPYIKKVGSA